MASHPIADSLQNRPPMKNPARMIRTGFPRKVHTPGVNGRSQRIRPEV